MTKRELATTDVTESITKYALEDVSREGERVTKLANVNVAFDVEGYRVYFDQEASQENKENKIQKE